MALGIMLRLMGKQQTEAALKSVGKETRKIGDEERKGQDAAARALKKRTEEQRKLTHVRDRAQAFSRIGGLGGTVGAAFSGASKGLIALGLAGVAAHQVVKSWTASVQRAEERIRSIVTGRQQLAAAQRAAAGEANSGSLAAALSVRQAIGQLAGGGAGALAAGRNLGLRLGAGGLRAAATLQGAGALTPDVQAALQLVAQSGLMTPEEFADVLAKNKGLMQGRGGAALAQAVLSKAGVKADLGATLAALQASGLATQFGEADAAAGKLFANQLARFAGGGTTAELRAQAGRVAAPEAAATLEIWRTSEEQLAVLRAIDEKQGVIARIWQTFTSTDGSAGTRLIRAQDTASMTLGQADL